jgi:hypothetical protein
MAKAKKPKVTVNCVADKYATQGETIIEFSSEAGGGLISFRVASDGKLLVDLYRMDPAVVVRVPKTTEAK